MNDWQSAVALEASARAAADIALGNSVGGKLTGDGSYVSAATAVLRSRVNGDGNPRFEIDADGKHQWGDGTNPLDANLYRVGAGVLKTDGYLYAGLHIYADQGAATQTGMGGVGPSSQPGLVFGIAGDTNLYRAAADTLKTNDLLWSTSDVYSDTEVRARVATIYQAVLGIAGPGLEPGILLGVAGDTNLYRSAADTLKTDDLFHAGNGIKLDGKNISTDTTTGSQIATGATQKLGFYGATPIVQPANTVDYVTMLTSLGLRAAGGTAPASFPGAVTSSSPTLGMGYATGAGGAVTQITSRATTVVLNKICGQITTHTASLAAGAEVEFTVTNSTVAATDVVNVAITPGGTGTPMAYVSAVAAGSFKITITNLHASTADTSADVINFAVLKAVAA